MIETGEGDYKEEILALNDLAQKLRKRRFDNGSINFDRHEVKFDIDESGKPIGVYFKVSKEANKLIEDRYIDYEKYIRAIDPSIPHSFLQQIIDHIVVNDGRVTSITFKNGATHTFTYKT